MSALAWLFELIWRLPYYKISLDHVLWLVLAAALWLHLDWAWD